jgi:Trypsin-like peptidase domain
MPLTRPDQVVWFVETTLPDGSKVEGSAVAVRLQRTAIGTSGIQEGDPNTEETFLLTCGHVLRGRSSEGIEGLGKLVSENDFRVWMPETAHNDDQAKQVRIVTEIRRVEMAEIASSQRDNPLDDWLVLELVDKHTAMASPALYASDFVEDQLTTGDYIAVGYPGGSASFQRGVVTPTITGPFRYRDTYLGLLRLVGTKTAAGMSGGGVFRNCSANSWRNRKYQFCGLHRAREFDTLQLHSISSLTIGEHFASDQIPFEICRNKSASNVSNERTRRLLFIGLAIIAILVTGFTIYPKPWRSVVADHSNVIVRLFDADTHDRILRTFTLDDPDNQDTLYSAVDRFEVEVPPEALSKTGNLRVKCNPAGLYQESPDWNVNPASPAAKPLDPLIRPVFLHREDSFVDTIRPDANRHTRMSGKQIVEKRKENVIPPDQVTVIVDNRTSFKPDILFCPLFDDISEELLKFQGSGCFPIPGTKIGRRSKSEHREVFDGQHIAAVFVSFEGQDAEFIGEGSLCSFPYLIITIEQRNSPCGKIEFSSTFK